MSTTAVTLLLPILTFLQLLPEASVFRTLRGKVTSPFALMTLHIFGFHQTINTNVILLATVIAPPRCLRGFLGFPDFLLLLLETPACPFIITVSRLHPFPQRHLLECFQKISYRPKSMPACLVLQKKHQVCRLLCD